MATRPIWLAKSRNSKTQRAHFALFIPNTGHAAQDPNDKPVPCLGTQIHVVGTPMTGYVHEFKRNFDVASSPDIERLVPLGEVESSLVIDSDSDAGFSTDSTPRGRLDQEALQVPAPRRNENFMAPVNDTTNRRCQEWTIDFVRHMVREGLIDESVVDIVQAERDPPAHGIVGLQAR